MILGFQRLRRGGEMLGLFLSEGRNRAVSLSGSMEFVSYRKGEVSQSRDKFFLDEAKIAFAKV